MPSLPLELYHRIEHLPRILSDTPSPYSTRNKQQAHKRGYATTYDIQLCHTNGLGPTDDAERNANGGDVADECDGDESFGGQLAMC